MKQGQSGVVSQQIIARSARLTLRRFGNHDAEAMMDVLGDPDVMRFSDLGVLSRREIMEWTRCHAAGSRNQAKLGRWAVVETDSAAVTGYIGLTREPGRSGPDEAELGFRLARRYWGQGYASEAAGAALSYGFDSVRLQCIFAVVDPANAASVRVLEKLGMRFDSLVSFPGYTHPDRKYVLSRPGTE
ncbi:MAG: GNAT family N-acetyltransferase [Alphaproteobacteria bacterium]